MSVPPGDIEGTFLTERQVKVLTLRYEEHTQREIAEQLGTSIPNISSIERAARDNIEAAHRTIDLAIVIRSTERITIPSGTDLRSIIDELYTKGDTAGVRIKYAEPELTAVLHDQLEPYLRDRRVTRDIWIGISSDGDVVTFPTNPANRKTPDTLTFDD